MKLLKTAFQKYWHAIPLLIYGIIYMSWFGYLEKTIRTDFYVIHMDIDDVIPFWEIFIIPYLLWFAYVAVVVVFLFFKNRSEYAKCCIFLATGMTLFLTVSALWPNGHLLRPQVMPRDNIFTQLIANLYQTDTSTNIWPSIHVYNSLGSHIALMHSRKLKHNRVIRTGSGILAFSIVLSTVFLKQHSAYDVFTAFMMAAVLYVVVYKYDIIAVLQANRARRKAKPQIS